MYYFVTWGLMVVIPALCVGAEAYSGEPDLVWLTAKWFVFWGIGVRLLIAGLRQVCSPEFTAQTIFRIQAPEAEKLVREIGFGNLAMGLVATLSIAFPEFVPAAALTGGVFLGLAGIKHAFHAQRSAEESTALVTDLIIAIVGIGSTLLLLAR